MEATSQGSKLLFPKSIHERMALIHEVARRNRPPDAPAGSFGYSGGSAYQREHARELAIKHGGDAELFLALEWESFYSSPSAKFSESARDEAARFVADRLRQVATGRVTTPAMWKRVAKAAGIEAKNFCMPSKSRGECATSLFGDDGMIGGTILVNTAYPKIEQAKAWVHELSHLILFAWAPPFTGGSGYQFRYDDDRDDVGHDIARRVEGIIFAPKVNKPRIRTKKAASVSV